MDKTKNPGNRPRQQSDVRESEDISNGMKNETGKPSEADKQAEDRVAPEDLSSRDDSQQFIRPKGMDA